MMKKALATATLIALLPLSSQAADITLEVEGLDASRTAGSVLLVGVYTASNQWLDKAITGRSLPVDAAVNGKLTVVLKDLPDGPLALSLFHDANANGRLDMNPMGIPMEPYGFSNNAIGQYGPPKFEQAVLTPAAGASVKVRLN
ncbi:DUF2141 domain-containing protein [Roseateles sp. P5_E7]